MVKATCQLISRNPIHLPDQILGLEVSGQVGELLLVFKDHHFIPVWHFGVLDVFNALDRTFEIDNVHHPFPLIRADLERAILVQDPGKVFRIHHPSKLRQNCPGC